MNISKSKILLDLDKSNGSFAYCKNRQKFLLDLHGHFSSLPLGYNHSIFWKSDFRNEVLSASHCKISSCEYETTPHLELVDELKKLMTPQYDFYHFACTGSLAVEWACKAAIDITGKKRIVSFTHGFHGVAAYGNFLTNCANDRLQGFEQGCWDKFDTLEELETLLQKKDVAAVIFEPINCTAGDIHPPAGFLDKVIELCSKYDVLSIADEIQTGLSTDQVFMTGFKPDITVFGKKFQVSGFATRSELGQQLKPGRFCVTFDGDVLDMIRSKYILRYVRENNLMEWTRELEKSFKEALNEFEWVKNVRGTGLILAFDLESGQQRDDLISHLLENDVLVNAAGEKTIRLRPGFHNNNLDVLIFSEKMRLFLV